MDDNLGLSQEVFLHQIVATQKEMAKMGLDGLVAISSSQENEGNLVYLTNHHISFPHGMSGTSLSFAAAVLSKEGEAYLVIPLASRIENVSAADHIYARPDLVADIVTAIKQKKLENGNIGIVGKSALPPEYYVSLTNAIPKATLTVVDHLIESQRMIKTPEEIDLLRESALLVDTSLQAGLDFIRAGTTEDQIERVVRQAAMQAGANIMWRVRVSSGTCLKPADRPATGTHLLQKGDLVFLDMSGWRNNYAFDASRVTVVGKPTRAQVDYLNHLAEATEWMIEEMLPDRSFRFNLTESRGRLIHPSAHGIGLEICENPRIDINKDFVLKPGMVVCVEPSVLSKTEGEMAIKEMVLISEKGTEILTKCPRRA